jgi:hypothetical protein
MHKAKSFYNTFICQPPHTRGGSTCPLGFSPSNRPWTPRLPRPGLGVGFKHCPLGPLVVKGVQCRVRLCLGFENIKILNFGLH